MLALAAGVALFIALHLLPMVSGFGRDALVKTLGELPYKALFALITLGAVVLMVWGWRIAPVQTVYATPAQLGHVGTGLAFAGVVVFLSSVYPSRLRRWIGHPQFFGVILWSAGHLLHGAALHSLILFGGLGLWATAWTCLAWAKRPRSTRTVPFHFDLLGVSVSLLVAVGIAWVHALAYGNLL